MGVDKGTVLKESDNYKFKTPNGEINLSEEFLKESEDFELIKPKVEVEEYIPDTETKKYKLELIIDCSEVERDNIRSFLEKNIEDIKSGKI